MNIAKLIDDAKTANVSPEFQDDFFKMMQIFHEVNENGGKAFPKGKMENMLEQLIELIKKDKVIPMELTPVGPQLKKILNSYSGPVDPRVEQILKMRKDHKYEKYINLLDFMGLSILTMEAGEKSGGAIFEKDNVINTLVYIAGLAWSFFSIFTGILAGSVTWKKLKKAGVHPALVGFTTFLVGIITTIIVAVTPNTVYDEVKISREECNTAIVGGASAMVGGALLLEDPYLAFKIGMLMFLAVIIVVLLVLICQCIYKIYQREQGLALNSSRIF